MALPAPILTQIARAAREVSGRPFIIGIDGPSGAGKSTLAGGLASALDDARVIAVDDFYADIDWSERATFAPAVALRRDYDWPRLREQVLEPARAGVAELTYQRYDWDAETMGAWVTLATPGILIVEGLFILRPELRPLLDFGIYVDAPSKLRRRRQRQRHALYPPEIQARQNAMIEFWAATEDHYISTLNPRAGADLILEGAG